MRRRTRLIAGIFALVAMTFAFAETVLASTCAPGMDRQTVDVEAPHAPADDCMRAPSPSHDSGEGGEDEPNCPFAPAAAAQGCTGAASLPAHAVSQLASSPEGVIGVLVEQSEHDLLIGIPLFRPPRA